MTRVGYIAGRSLEELQEQWVTLLDADANVILFDRSFLPPGFRWSDRDSLSPEAKAMWDYVSAMEAGQNQMMALTGGGASGGELADLAEGDHLLIADHGVIDRAAPTFGAELIQFHNKGVQIEILNCRFTSSSEYSDLHLAAVLGSVEVVDALVKAGSTIDERTRTRMAATALYLACCFEHLAVVARLIETGADVNMTSAAGFSCLHEAARTGNVNVMQSLMEHGAKLDQTCPRGSTPLCWTVLHGHGEAAKLLLENGADPNVAGIGATELAGPLFRMTPVYYAAANNESETAKLLLKCGADPLHPNAIGPGGHSALHEAARAGDLALVKALLEAGLDPHSRANDGSTPLDWVSESDEAMVQLLQGQ